MLLVVYIVSQCHSHHSSHLYIHLAYILQTDAVVTSNDTRLGFDGLVSQVLLKAAGDALQQECASKAPIQVGDVTVTKAGRMRCKNILHVVLPNYDGPRGKAEKVHCNLLLLCDTVGREIQKCTCIKVFA